MMKLDSRVETYRLYLNGLMKWRISHTEAKAETKRKNYGSKLGKLVNLIASIEKAINTEKRNAYSIMAQDMNGCSKLMIVLAKLEQRTKRAQ